MKYFKKSFTQQEPLSDSAIQAATEVMLSGRLYRYNTVAGEPSEVDLLEQEFAAYLGAPYCLACSSGGYAIHIAMRAAGVKPGDKVLSNAFTLAPVPGAIHNSGAIPILIEVADDYCIDLDDLEAKASTREAKVLLLSHMRGHIADMDRIAIICQRYELFLIEDCAHTMGAKWNTVPSGLQADIACYSTQTYKHINSGEGGLLVAGDDKVMARAIIYSGSYMFFDQHRAAPPAAAFENIKQATPNYSGRMDNLRASILRPQLTRLDQQCARWNRRYKALDRVLRTSKAITIPNRQANEQFVGSSLQFSLCSISSSKIIDIVQQCGERGVVLKWFGEAQPSGYTSRFDSWQYINDMPQLTNTQRVLSSLLDIRIPSNV
jgi:dTDP-4-amino-4,6-dideoxygalactose transaminase